MIRALQAHRRPLPRLVAAPLAGLALIALTPHAYANTPRGPAKVLEVLSDIHRTLKLSRYQHQTIIRPARGEYFFDCSGMADIVLRRGAPMARRQLGHPQGRRPLARDYYRHISRIRPGKRRGAWLRVPDAASTRPGDVVTWVRPSWWRSRARATGHVAFVVSPPVPVNRPAPGVLVRVADASRYRHQDDSRENGQTGYGTGVLLITTDPAGQPNGYGWVGALTPPEWLVPTKIAIGRPLR